MKRVLSLMIISFLSTTMIAFADDIKIIQKNGSEFIPLKKLIKNLGGDIKENKSQTNLKIKSKQIIIINESSFAKVDDCYYPLETKSVNGFNIPVDNKNIEKNGEIYVTNDFLKSINIQDFKVENGKVVFTNNLKQIQIKENKEKNSENKDLNNQNNAYKGTNKENSARINNTQIINKNNKTEEKINNNFNDFEQNNTKENDKVESTENNKGGQLEGPKSENVEISE